MSISAEQLVEEITNILVKERNAETDEEIQFCIDISEHAVQALTKILNEVEEDTGPPESPPRSYNRPSTTSTSSVTTTSPSQLFVVDKVTKSEAVHVSNSIYIDMESKTGFSNLTVSDVSDWLREVVDKGIPHSTSIEGSLYLAYDPQKKK